MDAAPRSPSSESAAGDQSLTESRFSLSGLSAAFARLAGSADNSSLVEEEPQKSESTDSISPKMIVEGMLFVGNSDDRPLSCREIAACVRDVSPNEIDSLVETLNAEYEQNSVPYEILSDGRGYRLQLRASFQNVRRQFFGKIREAKLSPPALEVLSVVAYRQPVSSEEVTRLRGSRSGSLLNLLVRRGLISLKRPSKPPKKPVYETTEKFNRLFSVTSPADLPSSEDLDDK